MWLIGGLFLAFWCQQPVLAAGKVALIIGNGSYTNLPALPYAQADAKAMAKKLKGLGFRAITAIDADKVTMERQIAAFEASLQKGGVGLFYFSGHGVQHQQKNYLVPLGANINTSADVVRQGVAIDQVIKTLRAKPRDFNLVILDACNDASLDTKGLARMEAPSGTFLAFAASPGQLASAGWDGHSLFTSKLLKHIDVQGLSVHEIFQNTRAEIVQISRNQQIPFEQSFLTKTFYFRTPKPAGSKVAEAHQPLDKFRDCAVCPEMVMLPAGKFMMGSKSGDRRQQPVHPVEIKQPVAIGIHEVTVGEWGACVAEGRCNQAPIQSARSTDRHPITNVNWDDAQSFIRWLAEKTGRAYRLPSEAEWEYAARAGGDAPYSWGTEPSNKKAVLDRHATEAVGGYSPNGFGLFDVHGNVWEWVEDCFARYTVDPSDGRALTDGAFCKESVMRGGSWRYDAKVATVSFRATGKASDRRDDLGFRVARFLD